MMCAKLRPKIIIDISHSKIKGGEWNEYRQRDRECVWLCVCLRLHAQTLRATLSNKPINKLYSSRNIPHLYLSFVFCRIIRQFGRTRPLFPSHSLSLSLPFLHSHSLSRCLTLIPIFILSIVRVFFFVAVPCKCVCALIRCVLYSLCFYLSLTLLVLIFPFSYIVVNHYCMVDNLGVFLLVPRFSLHHI